MKKTLLALLVVALGSSSAFALSGVYVGANVGYANGLFNNRVANTGAVSKTSTGIDGFAGGIFAGYAYQFEPNPFNVAAEINLQAYRLNNMAKSSSTQTDKQTLNYSSGIDLMPGFYISKTINLFGVLGYQQGQFRFSRNVFVNNTTDYSETTNLSAWDVGFGTSFILANNFALRLIYKYTQYGSKTFRRTNFTQKITPRNGQFNLGVTYTFGGSSDNSSQATK
jgi:outer membrane immunogenic protein